MVAGGRAAGSGDFGVHRFVDPAASFRKFRRGIGIDLGQRGFGQGTAALLRAAVEAGGVAAQTEDQQDGDIFRHREADRAEGGEAERDDLGDRQEVGRVARDVGVDGLDRSGLGTDWIAVGGGRKNGVRAAPMICMNKSGWSGFVSVMRRGLS